ncbi:hypothetical protein EJ07DRAFT_152519 [Lizonia empirigonia]|nr:hypothetical protein EJ07DRAFT_152519 [Lizonia empirigonia]
MTTTARSTIGSSNANSHINASRNEARHEFLRSVIGTREDYIEESKFAESVKKWEIPSLEQDRKEAKQEDDYWKQMSIWRRAHAYWAVKGPEIAFLCLVAAFMVAFGHLSGSFVFGSMAHRQDSVALVLGADAVPRRYIDYVRTVPGWTGLTAISCFYHASGFRPIEAELELLDEETTLISVHVPHKRPWDYKAGQYVFVQIPQLSCWKWHLFTVSTCVNNRMQVHIKADGDWTNDLRDIAKKAGKKSVIKIGLDGPSPYENHRRVDFHWMVRDKNNLLWFSDLLN